MRNKVCRAAVDGAYALLGAALVVMGCAAVGVSCAYGYVDPSVMTYTIQALAGVAVALSAVFGVVWRRTRKKLFALLHIDENAGKEIEPDVHRVDASGPLAGTSDAAGAGAGAPSSTRARSRSSLSWPKRFGLSLLASVFLSFTVLVVAPLELVASNGSSLIYGIDSVAGPVFVAGGAVAVCLALVLSILRGRAFDVALALAAACGVGAYVQAMLLNASLPPADGVAVMWTNYVADAFASAGVWLALAVVFVVLMVCRVQAGRLLVVGASLALVVVQTAAVVSLWVEMPDEQGVASVSSEPNVVTKEGLFELSPKKNVVMFVLDTVDTNELNRLFAQDPSMLSEMTGFTYFRDSIGPMIPTRYAVPQLLTGKTPTFGQSFAEYRATMYQESTLLDDMEALGYSIGVYSDSILQGTDYIAHQTENIHPLGETESNFNDVGAVATLWKCSLYRDAPWMVKPFFQFSTDEVNQSMVTEGPADELGSTPYVMDDVQYYQDLTNIRLSSSDEGDAGAFRLIHLLGAHQPYVMDENAAYPRDGHEVTCDQQTYGTFKIVSEYIRQMKELGVYDQSEIIITSDHGYWYWTMDYIDHPTSAIMLVKPPTTPEESAQPVKDSYAPVSHVDLPATMIQAMGGDSSKYGQTVFEIDPAAPRTRYHYMLTHDGDDHTIKEYAINGYALDWKSWSLTGREWEVESIASWTSASSE